MDNKHVYFFGSGMTEGKKEMKSSLGGKGANLADMASIGVPVPSGFTITTEACEVYNKSGQKLPDEIRKEVLHNVDKLEKAMGLKFGNPANPLLVSVRSGAAVSMPGMMDTVLNLGMSDTVVEGLAKKFNNDRFAWDSYRRFCQMFGDVVMNVAHHEFEDVLDKAKHTKGVNFDTELDVNDLKGIVKEYKILIKKSTGTDLPNDPIEQLFLAIGAVFNSWDNERAIVYRRLNNIRGLAGTAVNIQSMVFGNMGEASGTGVCFTRNPSTGENLFYGEYLMNAQGEDVVAGTRTPQPISTLDNVMPECYRQLVAIRSQLEKHYTDMQDIEFTIQEGKLYILPTRNGKRTAAAAVKIAMDMLHEGLIDEKTAVLRVDPASLDQLLHKQLDPLSMKEKEPIAKGLPASPGAAVGKIVFTAEAAVEKAAEGNTVILVRTETSPEDLIGMNVAQGILTSRGGMTSHAAVVARGMGKCCIAGCADAIIDEKKKVMKIGQLFFQENDYITLDGSKGDVYLGKLPVVDPELSGDFGKLMLLADKHRRLKVRANADIPRDANIAVKFGAEGIGLCRTEHMFFEGERIKAMREMILAKTLEQRKKALAKLLPYQKSDFKGLFTAMGERPVTIRLLDPPLHEFLPHAEDDKRAIATETGVSVEELQMKINELAEVNPMLGHRGCRLGITYPEITEMQTQAIIEAAIEVEEESGISLLPEIMIPLVGNINEYKHQSELVKGVADKVIKEKGSHLHYKVGTMIEVPRGALTADEVAKEAEFFSFGTNDLTQMTLGFSRDDVGKFVPEYLRKNILEHDPFQVLDQTGVGQLIHIAIEKGRKARPGLKVGICGEHGGEPSSIEFCHRAGLDYVSCSPFRVPIARLAAAHAALKN
ncbi:MAG: pyruvate, phosphate dikinase [Candidatus Woesearchaeota archaeon]